jgi:hypothetical protein
VPARQKRFLAAGDIASLSTIHPTLTLTGYSPSAAGQTKGFALLVAVSS